MTEELKLGWGSGSLTAKGSLVVLILLLAGATAFLEYEHAQRAAAQERQHDALADALELQTCIQSIPAEERIRLREDLKASPNPAETLRLGWCPWLQRLDRKR